MKEMKEKESDQKKKGGGGIEKEEGKERDREKASNPSIIPPALVSLLPINSRIARLFQIAGPFYASSGAPKV
jgi:hypothetical protein